MLKQRYSSRCSLQSQAKRLLLSLAWTFYFLGYERRQIFPSRQLIALKFAFFWSTDWHDLKLQTSSSGWATFFDAAKTSDWSYHSLTRRVRFLSRHGDAKSTRKLLNNCFVYTILNTPLRGVPQVVFELYITFHHDTLEIASYRKLIAWSFSEFSTIIRWRLFSYSLMKVNTFN